MLRHSSLGQERRAMQITNYARVAAIALSAVAASAAIAADISGAGATFPYPIYAKWADTYKTETGNGLNYQSIGSGGGIKQIKAKTVTFGASDMPLAPKDVTDSGLVQFPTVVGGDVPVVNLDGVKAGDLVLDGPTLADIFLGKITKWDDPAIKKLNPNAKLPSDAIVVVHRSDGSGTTFIFTNYLSKISPEWKDKVGASTAVEWPTGIGAKGNEGVSNNVTQTKGSIGYVEYAYAKQNKMASVNMINLDGKAVAPDAAAFQAAGATFILMHKQPDDPAAALEALKFFAWAYAKGGKAAEDLDYVPLPATVVDQIKKTWSSEFKTADGKPLFASN